MSSFANAAQFAGATPFERASGAGSAIVDPQGNVIGHVMTGGIIDPKRCELQPGNILFRFGASGTPPMDVAKGPWWLESVAFDKAVSFANTHEINVGLAVRLLCLVPPEWSDLGTLIRVATRRPLLAYRGFGNSVVVPIKGGLGTLRLPHQNDIAARRVYQLYIPGLVAPDSKLRTDIITVEKSWKIDPRESMAGFLYL